MSEQQIIYQMEPASQIVDFPINEDTFSVYSDNSNPRYSPYPESAPSKSSRRRPGRNPEVPDEALDQIALERRNRRRERNRLAAARCRDRRLRKVEDLEGELSQTKSEMEALKRENQQLKEQLEKVRFNLAMNGNQANGPAKKEMSQNQNSQLLLSNTQNSNTESGYASPEESIELEEVKVPTTASKGEKAAMLAPIQIVKQEPAGHYHSGPLSAFLMTPNGGLALTPLLHGSFAFPASDANASELFNAEFCQL